VKIVLFDLEETLIESWEDPTLLCGQFPKILSWVKEQGDFRAGLFSWAVWDANELKKFNKGLRQQIEEVHGFRFDDELMFTRNFFLNKFREWFMMPWMDCDDFTAFFKKRQAIEEVWLRMFDQPNTELVFIDDTIPSMMLIRDDVEHNTLQLVDVKTLKR
jgi:FMN phosphatase YigB (HAD superfamily)